MQQKLTSERQISTKTGLLIKNFDLKIGSLKAKRNQSFRGIATLFATRFLEKALGKRWNHTARV